MRGRPRLRTCEPVFSLCVSQRCWSSASQVQHVTVPCASSGDITVSLHDVSHHPQTSPLLVYIPPFATPSTADPADVLPSWCNGHPSAVIHYRWPGSLPHQAAEQQPENEDAPPPLAWPIPLHDVLFGYSWLTQHLAPANGLHRRIYVLGSYLGASLAAALSITESHADNAMAIRGFVGYNGIYNWTKFLPDHEIHQKSAEMHRSAEDQNPSELFQQMKGRIPQLFGSPANLFDPFASPSLLFRSSGMWVPSEFDRETFQSAFAQAVDGMVDSISSNEEGDQDDSKDGNGFLSAESTELMKTPRKAFYNFPPAHTNLRLPDTLLLHEVAPSMRCRRERPQNEAPRKQGFALQARELGGFMRRSIIKYEARFDGFYDHDEWWEEEAMRRVQFAEVEAVSNGSFQGVEDRVLEWLATKMPRYRRG